MNSTNKKILLVLTCFLFSIFTFSQKNVNGNKTLSYVLKSLEKKFEVKFSYANKTIENILIVDVPKGLSLKQTITFLEKNSKLTYTFLTEKEILISKPEPVFTICGYLTDITSKKPIEGVLINVLHSKTSATSDSLGYFVLKNIHNNQNIQINHVSYPAIVINSNNFLEKNNCLTITMSQKVETLKEVILNNFLTKGISIKTDNSITINTEKFGILPGLIEPDILHNIQSLPGISSSNETISNINIRGGTNDENLLLWDGIKMYHSGHFFGLISAFNPYLTNTVTIIKNGTSPQYNDGVSGTIAIETNDEIKKKMFGGAGFNLLSADAFLFVPVSKKFGFQFAIRRALTDVINTPTFREYFKTAFQDSKVLLSNPEDIVTTSSNFNFYDYSFKFLYDLNKNHNLRLSYLTVENKLHLNKTFVSSTNNTDSKTSELEQKNVAIGLRSNNKWSEKFRTTTQLYYTKYNIYSDEFSLLTGQSLLQKNEVLETGLKINSYFKLSNTIQLLNGYNFYELGITNSEDVNKPLFTRTIKNVIDNHAFFSEINYSSKDNKTFINSGFRVNFIPKFKKFLFEPRIQAMHKINPNFAIKIAGEYKSQFDTQVVDLQDDFLGVAKNRWVMVNNADIPIIKSKQVSAGFNYNVNGFIIDLEGFYKDVIGITTSNQGFQNQLENVKTSGSYKVNGIEFLINKQTKYFSTWLGYTYNYNTYNFNEISPSIFPNNIDIRHSVNFGSSLIYKNFNLSFGFIWHTGKPFTTPTENNTISTNGVISTINYNAPNSRRLTSYLRSDISSTYKFKLSEKLHAMVGFSILNVFDNKNILNSYYKLTSSNTLQKIDFISIDTTPNFTFRVTF